MPGSDPELTDATRRAGVPPRTTFRATRSVPRCWAITAWGPSGRRQRTVPAHYGAQTEIRTRGDYAYASFFSSDAPTPGRGMAIIDISSYNEADTDTGAAAANMSGLSFVRNNSTATAVMDLKVTDDGEYVFLGTQPFTALFTTGPNGEATDPPPDLDGDSFTSAPGAVVAVDVSDEGNPRTVGTSQVSGLGVHNLFHHRIGQDDYVFSIHDQPDGAGMYVVGPIEISTDGVDTWRALPGTLETNVVVGQSTNAGLLLGTAAGAVGAMAHQRDRLTERLSGLVGGEEA